jgi:uncharacterized protein
MPNRLADETSPYLQQHAENPVDWYAWGAAALARSRDEDKPILLSVGYSACHWCHVMAHESFEDTEVAALMNDLFVNIKIDREERPDLDQIYQTAHWMLTQRNGGWPLTMFLTPDQIPFFGGTYFPKTPRYNLPGFPEILTRVATFYRTHRLDLAKQNASLQSALDDMLPVPQAETLAAAPLAQALADLAERFDPTNGGFGGAPKFPHPTELEFCLRRNASGTGADAQALHIATHTLRKMADGGIYDQLGGGFARYSVDQHWSIPHFEKMLYDNGPLLRLCADAWVITHEPRFAAVVAETAAWILREMQDPRGGYYSTLDADSEHEEGKFYVWAADEARTLLTPQEFAIAAPHYGLNQPPNFEDHAWNLRVSVPLGAVAKSLSVPEAQATSHLAARAKLFAARELRVRPGRDEKILTSWNALMIKGMARAGAVFGCVDWIASAQRAADFLRATMWRDGRLLATYKDGRAHLNAYLDDYAFTIDALLELLQSEFRAQDFEFARQLAEVLLEQFEDQRHGGFFFTSHDHEQLIHRPKPGHDNATPSGNGVAAYALQRMGHLLGETRYLAAANSCSASPARIVRCCSPCKSIWCP